MFAEIFIDRNNVEAPLDLEKAIKLRSRYVLIGQQCKGSMWFRIQKTGKGAIEQSCHIPKYNFKPDGTHAHRRMLEAFVDKWAKEECEIFQITFTFFMNDKTYEDSYRVTHRDGARGEFES